MKSWRGDSQDRRQLRGDMEYKEQKYRKIIKGRIVECIENNCNKKANSEGLCWEHLDQERKDCE